MQNAFVRVGDKIIHRYNIISTNHWCYVVYEPTAFSGAHSNMTHGKKFGIDDWLGDIQSRGLPKEIDALPLCQRRINAVRDYHAKLNAEAQSLIHAHFPETRNHRITEGRLKIHFPHKPVIRELIELQAQAI